MEMMAIQPRGMLGKDSVSCGLCPQRSDFAAIPWRRRRRHVQALWWRYTRKYGWICGDHDDDDESREDV
jgi:hypothetical protein